MERRPLLFLRYQTESDVKIDKPIAFLHSPLYFSVFLSDIIYIYINIYMYICASIFL